MTCPRSQSESQDLNPDHPALSVRLLSQDPDLPLHTFNSTALLGQGRATCTLSRAQEDSGRVLSGSEL